MTNRPLGQPVDRYTFRFDRVYPHPITLVWRALTQSEHVDSWLSPGSRIDARPGGRFNLGFGDRRAVQQRGRIETFRPYTLVVYAFDNGDRMRFELSPVRDGTRLVLTHSIAPSTPDPDGTGPTSGDAPNGAAPRRPHPAGRGAAPTVRRLVERLEREDGGRRPDLARAWDSPIWRPPRPSDRPAQRSVPWDGRCRRRPAHRSFAHVQRSIGYVRLDFDRGVDWRLSIRPSGGASPGHGSPRLVARRERFDVLQGATPG